ncbi:hypothetical protein AC578_10225 [Pseudocercospora eumusae]|uniref:CoA-binding domain-containing protein n=1 Tax=Pseudocercospora eumusae TaxID=321146 RepID=A0A139HZ06_9PEZI|nr:hypothetical protein AC578_10225 [Pseudocercospora eumusae]
MTNSHTADVDMQSAAVKFFSAKQFAVAGASSMPSKFVRGAEYETVVSPSKLSDPENTSLSVITPPPITAKLLQAAKEAGVPAVWLQPGSFTDKELRYAIENFPGGAVGGYEEGTGGHEGWCVLVDGDTALRAAKRNARKDKPKNTASRQVERCDRFEKPFL